MKLSIIIVSWNTRQLLKSCLESIVNSQPSNVQIEIIIVDNGSSDGSREYLKKIVNGQSFGVIFNDRNLGFAKAVNQAIDIAKGKHVLLLNPDARIQAGSIKELLKFGENNSEAGVVGPQLINPDGTIQASCYNFQTIPKAIKEFWFGKKDLFSKYYPQTNKPTEVDALVGAVFLITDKALKRVGELDEKYFLYYEDIDYCKRVWQAGLKVYYLPSVRVLHEHGASGKKIPQKTNKWLIESSIKYHGIIKHYLINFIIWSGQKFCLLK